VSHVKSVLTLILIITLVLGSFTIPVSAQVSDISGHWAESRISAWIEKGWASGYSDGTFKPNNSVTRAEFMTLANKAFGYTKTTEISYSDVASADWYYVEVAKAMAAGYISGYEDGTIRPKNPISRQEAAAMLARILNLDSTANLQVLDNFTDKDSIPAWSKGAIAAVVAEGFMSGYPDGTFRPTRNITRAEAIVMLDNAVETTIIYEEEGTYGPEEDVETIKGNVTIASDGITLRNVIINGDLLIAEEVGDGEVKLKNVTVKGEVIVKGGGPNSVELEDLNELEGYFAMEIFNYGCELESHTGITTLYWDSLLKRGKKIWAVASDDNHNVLKDSCGGWVCVNARELSHDAIIEGLLSGRFYSSTGPEIYDYGLINGEVFIECSPVNVIHFVATDELNSGFSQWGEGNSLTKARFRLKGNEKYIRVECVDLYGKIAWTNPIFLK
jgi:hypothetical protein